MYAYIWNRNIRLPFKIFFFIKKSNLFLDTGNGNSAIIH